ncbi:hypothetical protein ColLi_07697 [Colletotrichum liriopes]|uniref:Uncharacterized protein n=1 Tax=Colletotrichum liriopes TaxID=708192 RepID=A0AA37GQC2_9PEZI|nr:hypothetical protein ColLi_07697 [Colletotrichum liriopes]
MADIDLTNQYRVDFGAPYSIMNQEQLEGAMRAAAIFNEYAPGAKPRAPKDSVKDVMKVINESTLENGRGGAYISHLGSKRWL